MLSGLIAGKSISELLSMARGSLKNKREDLAASLEEDLLPRHLYILTELHESVTILEQKFARLDAYLIEAMRPYQWAVELLQTIPGIDATSSAMILIEIGDDMSHVLAMLTGSPLGRHYVRAIMNLRARENRGRRTKAMPSSGISYASAPTRRVTPRVPWRPNTAALWYVRATKNQLLPLRTK